MNTLPEPIRRFLPTLTEVVSAGELAQQRLLIQPRTLPVASVAEQAFLARLDQLIDQLLDAESGELARATLEKKIGNLRQCLHSEFGPDRAPASSENQASGSGKHDELLSNRPI